MIVDVVSVVDVVKALLVVTATVVLGAAVVVDTASLVLLRVDVELVEAACTPRIEDAVVELEKPKISTLEPLEALLADTGAPGTVDEDMPGDELAVDPVEAVTELDNRNPSESKRNSREVVRLYVVVQPLDRRE